MEKDDSYLLIPKSFLQKISEDQAAILSILEKTGAGTQTGLGDYITEAEAKKHLGRCTSWFHKMRKTGLLPSSKVGGKQSYRKQDIQKLFDSVFSGTLKNKTFQNAKS